MTRQYATFDCGMWDDPEGFVTLSAGAQRTYFMLVTQRDIAPCGTLALTLRRWAATCAEKDVQSWIDELAADRYVLVDEDTEELLVRTFIRWDAGYKHAKRVQAVIAAALAIRSQSLRTAVLAELAAVGVSIPAEDATRSIRSVVTEVSTDHTPETTLLEREPEPFDDDVEPFPWCSKHPGGTEEACGPCGTANRRNRAWHKARPERERRQRAARQALIDACPGCDENGMVLDLNTLKPLGKCSHDLATIGGRHD